MALNLPKLQDVEKLSTNIIRIMGGNPSKFTLQGSDTYLLGTGPSRILLDTGEGRPSWSSLLSSTLKSEGCTLSEVLLSHWHHDHVGGVKDVLSISDSSSPKLYKNNPSLNPDNILDPSSVNNIADGQTFTTASGFSVKALHTPGHTEDHMSFVVTSSDDSSEVGSIFTADNVLGHGTAVFENLATYINSLHIMKDAVAGKQVRAYPGHGAVIEDAFAKLQEYIDHRKLREEEALNVLKYGTTTAPASGQASEPGKEWKSMDMVKVIYSQYPESLWKPAEGGLLMVLDKLKGEGKVVKTKDGKWKATEKAAL